MIKSTNFICFLNFLYLPGKNRQHKENLKKNTYMGIYLSNLLKEGPLLIYAEYILKINHFIEIITMMAEII